MKTRLLLLILCMFLCCPISVYGSTVDDVRDLLGKERVDEIFTPGELEIITQQYASIEKANLYVKLFEMGKSIDMNTDLIATYSRLDSELQSTKEQLSVKFQQGSPASEVLKEKSKLEGILHEIAGLREVGYDINVTYLPNIWEEQYLKAQNVVNKMSENFDIGTVGIDMQIPLNMSRFILTSPYGLRLNPITKDSISMHNGIDFGANMRTEVYSQWNGVVSKIYESVTGGKTIEVSHGVDLRTVYMHLDEYSVVVGQEVKQGELLGLSGNTGNSTGPHLHLSVYLDGETVNPIYLYGTAGLSAFKTYISDNPERNLEISELEEKIKDHPSKESILGEEELKASTGLILGGAVSEPFDKELLWENIYGTDEKTTISERSEKEAKEAAEKEALRKLLQE